VLSCYWHGPRIGAYLDGALTSGKAEATRTHLDRCTSCQSEADSLRRLRDRLRRSLAVAEPDWTGFWPGIVRGIEDRRRTPVTPVQERATWRPRIAWGGAVAALLLVSLTFWQMSQPPAPAPDGRVFVNAAATEDPRATVMVYSTPEQDVAVVWLLGLDRD
jgi:anti-sigma factor RsiW